MLSEQRRLIILDTLTRRGEVISVVEFSDLFQVSTMTIRRDLEQLEKEGKLRRVHGGAVIMQ